MILLLGPLLPCTTPFDATHPWALTWGNTLPVLPLCCQWKSLASWDFLYYADTAGFVTNRPDKTFAIRQVFWHGQLLPCSRYPNSGGI